MKINWEQTGDDDDPDYAVDNKNAEEDSIDDELIYSVDAET